MDALLPQADSVHLFSPLSIRNVTFRNRIAVSPMCQYSAEDGFATDWHLVHLGSRAVGGSALVIAEATAVEAQGRISPADLGIWKDDHIAPLARIARFIKEQEAAAGIQIAHAGRKASTASPWLGTRPLTPEEGAWEVVGPSPIPFAAGFPTPHELSLSEIARIVERFGSAAGRARAAGFDVLEIHAAHGYLLHEFLSPLSNHRTDAYGGTFEKRIRIVLEVVETVRRVWPSDAPAFLRISATDWADGGWDLDSSVKLARAARSAGIDVIDVSSGGTVPGVRIPTGPGYQTPFAARIRAEAGMPAATVGEITSAQQADRIVREGKADLVLLARGMLRNPYWALDAAHALGHPAPVPKQYLRAFSS